MSRKQSWMMILGGAKNLLSLAVIYHNKGQATITTRGIPASCGMLTHSSSCDRSLGKSTEAFVGSFTSYFSSIGLRPWAVIRGGFFWWLFKISNVHVHVEKPWETPEKNKKRHFWGNYIPCESWLIGTFVELIFWGGVLQLVVMDG